MHSCNMGTEPFPCIVQAMAQEEADAVAALMAAASGDVRSELEQPPEEEGSPPGALLIQPLSVKSGCYIREPACLSPRLGLLATSQFDNWHNPYEQRRERHVIGLHTLLIRHVVSGWVRH